MKIPKKQEDVKLKTYLKYLDFLKSLGETEKEDDAFILKNTVLIFYDMGEKEYDEISYLDLMKMYNAIETILNIKQELIPIFKLKGVEYGINPNFEDMTFAELIDCNTEDVLQQICVLYRPIEKKKGKKYTIKKYEANIEYDLFKDNITLDIYTGFVAFFLTIQQELMDYTLKSLKELVLDPEKKQSLEANGAGFRGYMNLLAEI